jgi:hypothetical protein
MTQNSLLYRVSTTVNSNVKFSKVYALASADPTLTESNVGAFATRKLRDDPSLLGSAIVRLSRKVGNFDYHDGRGDNEFHGILTKAFASADGADTVVDSRDSLFGNTVNVFCFAVDGVNETAFNNHTVVSYYTPTIIPKTKYWRVSLLGEKSGTSAWRTTTDDTIPVYSTIEHGFLNQDTFLIRTTLTSPLDSAPPPIDAALLTDVIVNNGGSGTNAVYDGSTTPTGVSILTQASGLSSWINMETNSLPASATTFDSVDYSMAMTLDIEFVNEETIYEFLWKVSGGDAALPYIVKIDYSTDGGVTYENDVTYVRDATQTQYPVLLAEFANTTDHMVLQRNAGYDGGSWSNAVSMAL